MKIEIRGSRVITSERLREYVDRRMRFALGRFSSRLQRVSVEIGDANGPRGGVDMYCRVVVELTHHPAVVAESTESDLRAAIDRTADRISRGVAREIERFRDRKRNVAVFEKEERTQIS